MASNLPPDPYEVLGVAKDAQIPEIRSAHRKLVLKYHPDKVVDPALKATNLEQFQRIQQAYELLSDEKRRLEYDERVKLIELRREMGRADPAAPKKNPSEYAVVNRDADSKRSSGQETKWDDFREARQSDPREHRDRKFTGTETERERERGTKREREKERRIERERERVRYREEKEREKQERKRAERKGWGLDKSLRLIPPLPRANTFREPPPKPSYYTTDDVSPPPQRRPYRRPEGIQVAKGHVNGVETNAIPDTGAEFNIIAAALAEKIGLKVHDTESNHCRLLRMANGKHIKTIGIVEAAWTFLSDSSQSWNITLHVLSDFVYDVILGSDFLFSTQTLSRHKERLSRIPRPLQSLSVLRVNLLGSVNRYLNGSLVQEPARALPDSGSEPSLLSYEYTKQRGMLLTMDLEDQNLLQFADGSLATTSGSIYARWVFPGRKGSGRVSRNVHFHILRGCPHNVILGQDVLDATDAFLEHEDSFIEVISESGASGLNLVIWASRKKKAAAASQVSQAPAQPIRPNYAEHEELQRRAIADRRIGRMRDGAEKSAALLDEKTKRREYDVGRGYERRISSSDSDSTRTSSTSNSRPIPAPSASHNLPLAVSHREATSNHQFERGSAAYFVNSAEIASEYEFTTGRRRAS